MKERANIFFLIFVLTIVLIRIEVFLFPLRGILINGLKINHFWIGIILVSVALLLRSYFKLKTIILSVGLGIMADELFFMIFSNRSLGDYWSIYSISGVIIVMILVFVFRNILIKKIYENNI